MTQESLSGQADFVTGADGFIGSHFVERLVDAGAQVRALVYYNSWNEIGWLKDIPPGTLSEIEIVRGDIRDSEFIRKAAHGMAYIFYLSSLIAIPYSYNAPRPYVDTNI